MHDPRSRLARSVSDSMLFVSGGCAVLILLLSSCSADHAVQRESQQGDDGAIALPYSIVCIIHGDGDYLYHDTSGNGFKADEVALAEAKRVAQQNPYAEVFIFHQRPRRHFLFLFPLRDGEFFYFRSGRLIANELYWRDQERSRFAPEVELFRRFCVDNRNEAGMFLYFGHEIPEFGGAGYDASYPERTFTLLDLASGLRGFTRDSARFDLLVLSTCFGGTPYTIGTLGAFARHIVASPDNLHLSYFDLRSLERLDLSLRDGGVPSLAKRFARQSFDRLANTVETAVSVAVYDVDRVQEFLHSVHRIYEHTLTTLNAETHSSMAAIDHCDCADLPAYGLPTMNDGVDVFYRPARFGRSKYKKNRSGWECWKERELQAATSQSSEPVSK